MEAEWEFVSHQDVYALFSVLYSCDCDPLFCSVVCLVTNTLSSLFQGILSRLHTSVPRICIHSWLSVDFTIGFAFELNVFSKNAAFKMLHRDRVKCISPRGTDGIMRHSVYSMLTLYYHNAAVRDRDDPALILNLFQDVWGLLRSICVDLLLLSSVRESFFFIHSSRVWIHRGGSV